jgi:hypothetical protein
MKNFIYWWAKNLLMLVKLLPRENNQIRILKITILKGLNHSRWHIRQSNHVGDINTDAKIPC